MSETSLAMITVLALAAIVPIAILIITYFLGGRSSGTDSKWSPYESGIMQTVGSAEERISVKFYLTAILFIIFDVEAVFLYPWAVNFKTLGIPGLIEMLVFLTILLSGFLYIWKKGALKWD